MKETPTVVFTEDDTLFRLMETALRGEPALEARRALHYFFGPEIDEPVAQLRALPGEVGLPASLEPLICTDAHQLPRLVEKADFLVAEREHVDAAMLERAAGRLRFIQKFGRDCENIDLEAAARLGIPVANLRRVSTISAAEHVIALILALARQILPAHTAARARRLATDAVRSEGPPRTKFNWGGMTNIQRLAGKTLGVVGVGENGLETVERARCLEMNIMYYKRRQLPPAVERRYALAYAGSLAALVRSSDFVSLHIPHTPESDRLMDAKLLAQMKPTAFLINTSRGGVVDERALYHALHERRIAGAALDVYRWEPLPSDSPLLELENVLWTTHNAGGMPEFMIEESREVLANVARVARGQRPHNLVTWRGEGRP